MHKSTCLPDVLLTFKRGLKGRTGAVGQRHSSPVKKRVVELFAWPDGNRLSLIEACLGRLVLRRYSGFNQLQGKTR